MTQAPPDEYLTTAQVAQVLGVTTNRVRQLVQEGKLPSLKQAGWWVRYRRSDVERLHRERSQIEEKR